MTYRTPVWLFPKVLDPHHPYNIAVSDTLPPQFLLLVPPPSLFLFLAPVPVLPVVGGSTKKRQNRKRGKTQRKK